MATKPLLKDFIGLNTHTVQFKPELYKPVTKLLRDYHNLDWDTGQDPGKKTTFPLSENKVNWGEMYGSWVKAGYEIDVCVQFGSIKPEAWKDIKSDAFTYGQDFARFFGPSGQKLATSVEIGNEPGNYPDPVYRAVFENMAKGIRSGDPRLKISTCATFDAPSGDYHKSLSCVKGLETLYDVINLHSYAQVKGWPTWERSYPEDSKIPYLKDIDKVIAWRDANAKGKEVWLTEFGYDSSTKPNDKTGDFKDWKGVTDTEQARYIVRSYLVFSAMDMDRAYLYWFNDEDKPSIHAAAGLTRHYKPKPSFHSVAHLLTSLGDYRFSRVIEATAGQQYVYEYQHGTDKKKRVWAVWSPTGTNRKAEVTLTKLPGKVIKAERMPLEPNGPAPVRWKATTAGSAQVEIDESPVYLWLQG